MITRFIVFTVLLSNIAIAAVLDQEPPVFTYCPKDINIDDITNTVIRVNWDRPLAKDNSGAPSSIQCNRVSGEEYSVPGSYQVFCEAKDQAGNKAECTFQLVLKNSVASKSDDHAHAQIEPLEPLEWNGHYNWERLITERVISG
ncbi:hypothetical protein AWC38_SpisGene1940 [Stylophora pistillata]|uniref:HYR domain-containing protein n=1 Tax=Stylophora pistillata TaxID=50429 RepID=A0A2B4SRC6_STYPI|nr:hypothetical protein AWC38_SpisGene1940 [Stylophora pistillata]